MSQMRLLWQIDTMFKVLMKFKHLLQIKDKEQVGKVQFKMNDKFTP